MFNFSALFSGDVVAASFDNAIHADAANGRVNAAFTAALVASYGVSIPAAPAQAMKAINDWLQADKAPRIAKGHGATKAAPAVAQALHALGAALHAAGKVKGLPMLADLAAWADPDKVAAKAAERSAAAKARAKPADKAVPTAPTLAAEQAKAAPKASAAELRAQAVNLIVSAASAGALTQAQIDALRAALETAQPAASKTGKTRNKPAPVTAPMLGADGYTGTLESISDDTQALLAARAVAAGKDAPALTH